ncbi:hypothetical protein KDA_45740 [Dictyobacter alpinus]|uniref:DUF3592 domain-containing protein n=1 Tax=Dictyobacter alpinus TaxID=2014873 RepID=A0A402BCQ3_9CHLR|nr:DUF3592 domain-containing protein [Dictyobacter alpinus]GCE29090.1 hypothetical protein KDA_45740 [Dictyobacter alpinus]
MFSYQRRYRARSPFLVAFILFVIGLVFGIIGLVFGLNSQSFMVGAVSTTGRIVQCDYSGDDSSFNSSENARDHINSSACSPVVSFTTKSGEEVHFTSSFSSSSYHPGDTVSVSYHANQPRDARISDFLALWLLPVIFGGIGVLFLLIGCSIVIIPLLVARSMMSRG